MADSVSSGGETPRQPPQGLTDDDIRDTYVTGGIVSTFADAATREEERSVKQIIRLVEQCKVMLVDKTKVARDSQARLVVEEAKLSRLEARAAEINAERARIHDSQLLELQKRRRLAACNDKLRGVTSELEAQAEAVYMETQVRDLAIRERDAADLELHKLRDKLLLFQQVDQQLSRQDKIAADYRVKQERRAVQRAQRRLREQEKSINLARTQRAKQGDQMAATAIALNKQATKKMASEEAKWKQQLEQGAKTAQAAHESRADTILELKRATEKANAQLRGANERRKRREREIAAKNKEEFDTLLDDGENPYEVFRRRRRDKDVARQRKAKIAKKKQTEMRIAARMIEEAKRERREAAAARKEVEYEEVYQREMGRAAKEARVSQYISKRTKGGEDIIDPTGRTFRIEPSQVTTIKDHAFGLGRHAKDRPDIVDMIRVKGANAGVSPDKRFLPKKTAPATGKRAATPPPLPGGGGGGGGGASHTSAGASSQASKARYVPRELTKLEKDMMKAARGRQRDNIVQKQVVWGKEYKGRAFLSEPAEIEYKDFVVGKPMRLRVVLTNVSYTFNSFKLLPLDDEIKDFFEFKFTPPGRMSAGMTCTILVTFSPKVNVDIRSSLRLLCATGPVSIPLRCLTRKAVPIVKQPVVAIGDVVLGEARTRALKITNDGALPVGFRIVRHVPLEPKALPAADDVASVLESKEKAAAASAGGSGSEGGGGDSGSVVVLEANGDAPPEEEEDPTLKLVASDEPELTFQEDNQLEPYSTLAVPFSFRPQRPERQSIGLRLEFDNPSCPPIDIQVQCRGVSVPIFVEKQVMDFQTCLFGKLYRMPLVLRNRGNIALKCLTHVPRGFRDGALEFSPTMGFVQAADKATGEPGRFEMQMKFKPSRALFKRLGEHANPETGRISVPIRVVAPDQVLPVIFTLTAKLTSSTIEISPPTIDFGQCFTSQAVTVPVSLTNTSNLPVKFGFVRLPPTIDVQPRDGFGVLLPQETLTRDVTYTPAAATEDKFKLVVRTTMNREFSIPCKATGMDCPLRLSYSLLKFRAMAAGERETHNLYLANTSSKVQTFEFQVPYPHLSQLKISPCVQTLEPGEQVRIEVEFTPQQEVSAAAAVAAAVAAAAADDETEGGDDAKDGAGEEKGDGGDGKDSEGGDGGKSGEEEGKASAMTFDRVPAHIGTVRYSRNSQGGETGEASKELSTEPWSRHAMWKVPCFIRSVAEGDEATYSDSLVLQVHTTTVERTLMADKERIDFKQVAVGQTQVVTVRLSNLGTRTSRLRSRGLNPHGPFTIVNALREVTPGEYQDVTLQFKPLRQRKFVETLTVRSGIGSVTIMLTGEGVSPSLQLTPESGLLDIGHVLQDNVGTSSFKLQNTSVFPLRFSVVQRTKSYCNYSPLEVVSCSPNEAVIPAGEAQEVTVTFAPDHMRRDQFVSSFLVDIPNQETETIVTVRGRCWDRQLYVLPVAPSDELQADHPDMIDDGLAPPVALAPVVSALASRGAGAGDAGAAAAGAGQGEAQTNYGLVLAFPKPGPGGYAASDVELTKSVTVGSCQPNDPKTGSAGTFEVVWDTSDPAVADGVFTVDNAKGSLNGGQEATLKFAFKPPPVEDRAAGSGNGLGQWTSTTARVILRGGYCSPGVPEVQSVSVVLRGFVPL